MNDQYASSFFRRILRPKLMPHVCAFPPPYRSVEKGIRNSAYHPSESTDVATVQLPSQFRLNPPIEPDIARVCPATVSPPPSPSFTTWPSYSTPAGVVAKTKPFCRSRYVSRMNAKASLL